MIRLDKYLAHAKLGSRKVVKQAIRNGYIQVNDKIIRDDNYKIDETKDLVYLDGEQISYKEFYYLMLHKPKDYICSSLDELYPSVLNLIYEDYAVDLASVGRLDVDTEGLLLLSNDGKFIHEITSPKRHVDKVYEAILEKPLTSKDIQSLEAGVLIDDKLTLPSKVEVREDKHISLTIQEGKYHQVKRMLHAVNNEVIYLKRVQIGSLVLDDTLELGQYRELNESELKALRGGK